MDYPIKFIEPLAKKLQELIIKGNRGCLQKAVTLWGADDDIDNLSELIRNEYETNSVLVVDFTPFLTLGTQTRLHRLVKLSDDFPFVALVKKGIILENLKTLGNISTIVVDEKYDILEFSFIGKRKVSFKNMCNTYLGNRTNSLKAHQEWANSLLFKAVPNALRPPPEGRRYTRLADDTWANLWIDIKSILKNPDEAFSIAYQLGYLISDGYSNDPKEEVFTAGNNNAYILASLLTLIFDKKELVMLDRLGPYPSLSHTRLLEIQRLEGKRCLLVEDVLGTGRETDLTILIIFMAKGQIERATCVYDLEIASPLLIPEQNILSLCKPSKSVEYKRLPKRKAD